MSAQDQTRFLSMTVLMTPDMANFSGNVHGGAILKLLDQVAYACASRYAGRRGSPPPETSPARRRGSAA
jgi:acyl-CoA hydrolase